MRVLHRFTSFVNVNLEQLLKRSFESAPEQGSTGETNAESTDNPVSNLLVFPRSQTEEVSE